MIIMTALDRLAGWWMDWRTDHALRNMPEMEFEIKRFKQVCDEQGWSAEMVGNMQGIAMFADMVGEILDAHDAKNYVQFEMFPRLDRGLRPILVTIQWAHGVSPSAKAARLEDALSDLLLSADCTWEHKGEGHDWAEACDKARNELGR